MIFTNRQTAGRHLADKLKACQNDRQAIILGLPRGGVVVAAAVAKKLALPLDIIVPRKISAPQNPEFAIGAVTLAGEAFLDHGSIVAYGISDVYLEQSIAAAKQEAARRQKIYRANRPPLILKNKTAILVDDGIATGATMRASLLAVGPQKPKKIIVAVPVIARDTAQTIKKLVDKLVYLEAPDYFGAVGNFYEEFEQTTDQEVIELLKNHLL
ncbi:MAG: phosphoribosyltransferase family protein [Patescibacteria group bacterium]